MKISETEKLSAEMASNDNKPVIPPEKENILYPTIKRTLQMVNSEWDETMIKNGAQWRLQSRWKNA